MNKQKNLEKLIFDIFDKEIEGTDIYNHEGSMWLIFTEERKWVVEFTKQKTLWYNYKHFNDILVLFGMELSEGAEYIKKWYEDKFIFNAVKQNASTLLYIDNVIDNGVKETDKSHSNYRLCVENTIQNGVKHTIDSASFSGYFVEDTIQNGVKKVDDSIKERLFFVEDTIQNGVINTIPTYNELENVVEDTVKNGVKKISYHPKGSWNEYMAYTSRVKDTIQNGVKEVEYYDGSAEVLVNDAIEKGIKETRGWGFTMRQISVEDTIENGVKDSKGIDFNEDIDDVIENGVKYMMSGSEFKNNQVEDIIKYSEKL